MGALIGVVGAVTVAVITFALDRARTRDSRWQDERIRSAVDFTRAVEAYRSAQKRRAHANTNAADGGPVDRASEDPALATAVGEARTEAWAAYHRLCLVAPDTRAPELCDRALREVAAIGRTEEGAAALDHQALDAQGEQVRATMQELVTHLSEQLRASRRRGRRLLGRLPVVSGPAGGG